MPQELIADDLIVGAMYRAKKPETIETIFRPLKDDRFIIWLNADRTALQYNGPGVAKEIGHQTITVEKFLDWASHKIDMPEE